ncbi:carbohydrate ABC transporter permease, partial [Vibrio fluvialis]|nr:carbohydrate ABC transporter permease [Vibrio fluvialis]
MTRNKLQTLIMHVFLVIMSVLSLFPFFWMVVSSTNKTADINIGKLSFGDQLLVNFNNLTAQVDLPLIFFNTAKIAIISTIATLLICSLAGYAFEIYRSKWRERVYGLLLIRARTYFVKL